MSKLTVTKVSFEFIAEKHCGKILNKTNAMQQLSKNFRTPCLKWLEIFGHCAKNSDNVRKNKHRYTVQ